MIRTCSASKAISLHELDLVHAGMSAALNDYFANGLEVESIERWSQEGGARIRRNRQQFIRLFPALAPMLALRPNEPFSDEICRAVDSGDELVKALAEEFDVSPSTIRHLRGVPWSLAMAGRQRDEMGLLDSLELIAQEKRPKTKDDWLTLWILIDSIGFTPLGPAGHVVSDLCGRGYDEAFQLVMDMTQDNPSRLGDLHDYFRFVQRWAITLLGEQGQVRRTAEVSATLFLCGYRFPALWHQSERWHEAILDPALSSSADFQELRWHSLLPEPCLVDGLIITQLCSANELRAEGWEMDHCVATYTPKCANGDAYVLSIRTLKGIRLSTVEISLIEDCNGVVQPSVVQHRGRGNGEPPVNACLALASLLSSWKAPEAQAMLKRSRNVSRESSARLICLDQDHYSLIPWESCIQIMEQLFPNYTNCTATLVRIASEVDAVPCERKVLSNPVLLRRFRRRFV
jgi:hypothetical protein